MKIFLVNLINFHNFKGMKKVGFRKSSTPFFKAIIPELNFKMCLYENTGLG